ncbi:hypothetical protein H1164_16100 [Thermoactinomyces daqus]|uniref:Uncharacterized protein n=1 Tax=Thermoactinomyces daqus TaxID=1329516 RepID=A0A7W1XCX9_9BACL|nr:hypothetical protein [Thermoactinomyces daqus]MBA4544370.1 hypothetical protein [Thermoactinomyces daqus]
MPKYAVKTPFIDRFTQVFYREGSIYETTDAARAEELRKGGFIGEEIASLKSKAKTNSKGTAKNENQ